MNIYKACLIHRCQNFSCSTELSYQTIFRKMFSFVENNYFLKLIRSIHIICVRLNMNSLLWDEYIYVNDIMRLKTAI